MVSAGERSPAGPSGRRARLRAGARPCVSAQRQHDHLRQRVDARSGRGPRRGAGADCCGHRRLARSNPNPVGRPCPARRDGVARRRLGGMGGRPRRRSQPRRRHLAVRAAAAVPPRARIPGRAAPLVGLPRRDGRALRSCGRRRRGESTCARSLPRPVLLAQLLGQRLPRPRRAGCRAPARRHLGSSRAGGGTSALRNRGLAARDRDGTGAPRPLAGGATRSARRAGYRRLRGRPPRDAARGSEKRRVPLDLLRPRVLGRSARGRARVERRPRPRDARGRVAAGG
jgi:hypothetical protein